MNKENYLVIDFGGSGSEAKQACNLLHSLGYTWENGKTLMDNTYGYGNCYYDEDRGILINKATKKVSWYSLYDLKNDGYKKCSFWDMEAMHTFITETKDKAEDIPDCDDGSLKNTPEIRGDEPLIIAVDFDETLSFGNFPYTGVPNTELIELLKNLSDNGDELILWTCRHGNALSNAVDFCNKHGLHFAAINDDCPRMIKRWGDDRSRKINADIYIDDRAGFNVADVEAIQQYIEKKRFSKQL